MRLAKIAKGGQIFIQTCIFATGSSTCGGHIEHLSIETTVAKEMS